MTPVRIVEFVFVALVIVAVAITAVVILRLINDAYMGQDASLNESTEQAVEPGTEALQASDGEFELTLTDADVVSEPLDHPVAASMQEYAPFILPVTWGAVAGTVIKSGRKNKLQLANELGVDWKTVDNHMEMLLHARLIEESGVEGTARYYSITENGIRVLALLAQGELEKGKGL